MLKFYLFWTIFSYYNNVPGCINTNDPWKSLIITSRCYSFLMASEILNNCNSNFSLFFWVWKSFDRNVQQKSNYKSKFSMVHGITEENIIRCISRPSKNKKMWIKRPKRNLSGYNEGKLKSWIGRNTLNWANTVKHLPPFNRMERAGKVKGLESLKIFICLRDFKWKFA